MALHRCHLQTQNLFFVHNNWPSNPWTSYMKPNDFALTGEVESSLTTKLEAKFQDEVDHEDFLDLNETL